MRKAKILIVDDIIMNRILIKEILIEFFCEVSEARNGKEAIEKLKTDHFDLLMIDIEMPIMNGLETTDYIRNKMKNEAEDLPIIAITAHNPDLF